MRNVEGRVTLTINGDERDCFVRGHVAVERTERDTQAASFSGEPEVMLDGTWLPLYSVNVDSGDRERISDALCDLALEAGR